MKISRLLWIFSVIIVLSSCAPALNRQYMKEGDREIAFDLLRRNPDAYKGKLYVFGGVIVRTRLTQEGSEIEGMHVPVDRYGYFRDRGRSEGRFLAIMPKEEPMLDPEVFRRGRRVTLAVQFTGLRKDRIDEMEYVYPVFRILQVHLWPRERVYYPAYYYDPWFYPYPYYFWDPWWSYPYYYDDYYYSYRGGPPPYYHRRPPSSQPPSLRGPERAPSAPGAAPSGEPARR